MRIRYRIAVTCALLLAGGCASTPAPAPEPIDPHWSYSRAVETDDETIALFDPDDLAHHRHDPSDWHEQDFAYLDDLASGRFAAVLTGVNGRITVRVTDGPLRADEAVAAGTSATLRLRVRQDRLLLSGGGDAWPSVRRTSTIGPHDERWLAVPNGDYKVVATVLETDSPTVHDYVIQLLEIDSIAELPHAPGVPQLVAGDVRPSVAGVNATGSRFTERCSDVPAAAELSPLLGASLPLPGFWGEVEVSRAVHARGRGLQDAGERADLPLVIAREARVGAIGVYIAPQRWLPVSEDRWSRDEYRARGRVACAVRIVSTDSGDSGFVLGIEPLPSAGERLPAGLATELVERFESWLRVSSDPAYRYKSAAVRRAPDYRSLVFGVMQHLRLPPGEAEALLRTGNIERAQRLIERMRVDAI